MNFTMETCKKADFRLGVLSYWSCYADEAETVVSAANGWEISWSGQGAECFHPVLKLGFRLDFVSVPGETDVTLPRESLRESGNHLHSLLLFPDLFLRHEGDAGCYLIPQQSGVLSRFCGKREANYRIGVYGNGFSECNMPIFGCADSETPGSGTDCVILGPGNCDAQLELDTARGENKSYRLAFRLFFRYECHVRRQDWPTVCEDFRLRFRRAEGDGRSPAALLAETYRNLRLADGEIKPLSERASRSPELANAMRSPEIRIRLAVKWPFPCTVPEQTPENEPDVHVFCSFDDVKQFLDKFHAAGVKHLNVCLVGWICKGHDGRFPQLLPVEQTLGGESKLRELVAHARKLGYFITGHDNHYDAYHISEDPIDAILIRNQEGAPLKDGVWGGGQAYLSCPKAMFETYSKRNLNLSRDLGFRGTHFTDCLSTTGLKVCWDENHPLTKSGAAKWRRKILRLARETIGSVECEGPFDFAVGELDRILYLESDNGRRSEELLSRDYADEIVPLYEMVYHGIILYNINGESINSLPGSRSYLRNLAFGGMPSFYFYRHFATKNYDPSTGLPVTGRFETTDFIRENIDAEAQNVRRAESEFIDRAGELQHCFIRDFQMLSDTFCRTEYSNGRTVWTNWGEHAESGNGATVPANSFLIV